MRGLLRPPYGLGSVLHSIWLGLRLLLLLAKIFCVAFQYEGAPTSPLWCRFRAPFDLAWFVSPILLLLLVALENPKLFGLGFGCLLSESNFVGSS